MNKNKSLDNLRHSTAHLLTAAVTSIWPSVKPTIGPSISDGFYYDFDFGKVNISDKDLKKIESKMRQIVKDWDKFTKVEVSETKAKEQYKNNVYKKELIDELVGEKEKITFYKSGDFVDLCRGGHVANPSKEIKHFKLLSIAGAYWRGDEKNKMLTRIYGTAFPTKTELDDHLTALMKAKGRDHRKIGKDLNLFIFTDLIGKGLPLLTDKGMTIRRELERFIIDEEIKRGYGHVKTPDLAKVDLFKKSGHYPYYKDSMYPVMKIDDEELILRPMTCPHHFELYRSQPRSYKELPLRIAELANQYRFEISGLMRVRVFTLADSHIFCTKDQVEKEIDEVLNLIEYVSSVFGLKHGVDYRYRLSKGDRKNHKKFFHDDKAWNLSENILKKVLKKRGANFFEAPGEAAFYGPKIDIQMKSALGSEETAFTVQYDFVLPKRFNLKFIDKDGKEKEVLVVHRSSIGALERFMAYLIEHFEGSLPVWLSPIQVKVLPITSKNVDYSKRILETLKNEGIRATIDDRNETLQSKIRKAQIEKVPYMLIVGDKEEDSEKIAVRLRDGSDLGQLEIDKFLINIRDKISKKSLEL